MAPYLTPTQLRERDEQALKAQTVDAVLAELVAEFEDLVEGPEGLGAAQTPRTVTGEVHRLGRYGPVILDWPLVRTVTAVTVDDTAWTAPQLADIDIDLPAGILRGYGTTGIYGTEVVVSYTHGLTVPPAAILRACRLYVVEKVQASTSRGRRAVESTEDASGNRYAYAGPDSLTGVPEADRLIRTQPDHRTPSVG